MEQIRVKSGIEINVNDAGDTIVANVESNECMQQFVELLESYERVKDDMVHSGFKDKSASEKLSYLAKKSKDTMAQLDLIFGIGACDKIFGKGITPSMYLIMEFLDQLLPIFQRYASERQQRIMRKYSRNRNGMHSL